MGQAGLNSFGYPCMDSITLSDGCSNTSAAAEWYACADLSFYLFLYPCMDSITLSESVVCTCVVF